MGLSGEVDMRGPLVGDEADLPDGTHACIHEVGDGFVRGVRTVSPGIKVRFWTSVATWSLLRIGIIPERSVRQ